MRVEQKNRVLQEDFASAEDFPSAGHCAFIGCMKEGGYKAPHRRADGTLTHIYLCRGHIGVYNKSWNYGKNLTPGEIERERMADLFGHRPTWPMREGRVFEKIDENPLYGSLSERRKPQNDARGPILPHTPETLRACEKLGLPRHFTRPMLKDRFKKLAKKYHPDMNGADKNEPARSELFKKINLAYHCLSQMLERHEGRI